LNLIVVYILALMVVATEAQGQPDLISNGTFDTNLDGWEANPPTSGTLEWVATQGQPPGALKMVGSEDQFAAPADCFHFEAGTIFFTADGFMESDAQFVDCLLNFYLYKDADDCTGEYGSFAIVGGVSIIPQVETPNQWEHLVLEVPIPDDPSETGVLSFRPAMIKFNDFGGDDACIFDNASLRIVPRGVTEVPALSPVGFAVLGLLLAMAALAVLRRGSP
jgi:hypothetical protein